MTAAIVTCMFCDLRTRFMQSRIVATRIIYLFAWAPAGIT